MHREDRQQFEAFLRELDGMIEATQEFIADDNLTPSNDWEGRRVDLGALLHVKSLYLDVFAPDAPVDIDGNRKER